MVSIVVFATLCGSSFQKPLTLDDLEKAYKQHSGALKYDSVKLTEINAEVIALLEADQIQTPSDFFRASGLITTFRNSFELNRIQHELCLCALAGGEKLARGQVKITWDQFIMSTGREQRIGSIMAYPEKKYPTPEAPKSIVAVMIDPEKALTVASKTKSDAEITKICDDDQAIRKQDWSKLTVKQMEVIGKADRARLLRIKQLLGMGRVITGEDFDHSSLVLRSEERRVGKEC